MYWGYLQNLRKYQGSNLRFKRYCGNYFFLSLTGPPTRCKTMSNNFTYVVAGGHITCNQCQATSKRSRQRCKAPAMKGKRVCKTHGGRSTGPKTEAGRQRCAQAKTIHGRETRETRNVRSLSSARLAVLEEVGFVLGFMKGLRTRGRKPNQMSGALQEMKPLERVYKKSLL